MGMDETLFQIINNLAGKTPWLDALMIFSAKYLPVAFAVTLVILYLTWQGVQQRGAFPLCVYNSETTPVNNLE